MDTVSYRMFIDGSFNRDEYIQMAETLAWYTMSRTVEPKQLVLVHCGEHGVVDKTTRPHFHIHFQTAYYKPVGNESRDRKAFVTQDGVELPSGQDLTVRKERGVTDPEQLRDHFSYPVKEGVQIKLNLANPRFKQPSGEELDLLMRRGKDLFAIKLKI